MKELYVVNCCRTAVGSFGGSLKNTPAAELGSIVVKEALKRANVAPENVDELMFGCILTSGLGQNVAFDGELPGGGAFRSQMSSARRPVRRSGQTTTACYRRAVPCAICRSRPGSRRGASVDPAFCNSKTPGGGEPRDLLEAGSEQLSVRLSV